MPEEMTTTTPSTKTVEARRARWIAIGMLLSGLLGEILVIGTLISRLPDPIATWWQILLGVATPIIILIASTYGLNRIRRGEVVAGMGWTLAGLMAGSIILPFIVAERGFSISILLVSATVLIASLTLPEDKVTRFIQAGVAVGIAVVLIDNSITYPRLSTTQWRPVGIILILVILAGVLLLTLTRARSFNLRTKLLVYLVVIPVAILSLVGGFFALNIRNQLPGRIINETRLTLADQDVVLTNSLNTVQADATFLSTATAVRTYLSETSSTNRQIVEDEFTAFLRGRDTYTSLQLINNNGQEIVRITQEGPGMITSQTPDALQNVAEDPFFVRVLARSPGETQIDTVIGEESANIIRVGTPVTFNGEKSGIVLLTMPARNMFDPVIKRTNVVVLSEIPTLLIDENGRFLTTTDTAVAGSSALEIYPDVAEVITSGGNGTIQSENDTLLYQSVSVPDSNLQWYLLNVVSPFSVLTPAQELLNPVIVLLTIVLMIMPLLATYMSSSIAAPIVTLTQAARSMETGNLDTHVAINREDEIGVLGRAFNSMNARLRSLINNLEERVDEQTRDLSLAAEIGATIGQEQSLDDLLAQAVETIRARFKLYYTQIYLVDDDGRFLVMSAGTGAVGRELLSHRFRLPLNPGSINGTAALEKHPVLVADTRTSPIFRPNNLLPDTRSELAIPLLIGNQVAGVLNLQSATPNTFNNANLQAFQILASQLAIAINNARLFSNLADAQSKMAAQAQRLTRAGWQSFLNGIDRRQNLGYVYQDEKIAPITDVRLEGDNQRAIPIQVIGQTIGAITVRAGEAGTLSAEEEALLTAVAEQIGQRVDNLRLLANAEQYRQQAEEATRRLTREQWDAYQAEKQINSYLYDRNEVRTVPDLAEPDADDTVVIRHPLDILGETIGEIEVTAPEDTAESDNLVRAVAAQLTAHIENLRLSEQTNQALIATEQQAEELQLINNIVTAVSASADLQKSLQMVADELVHITGADTCGIALLNEEKTHLQVIAEHQTNPDDPVGVGIILPVTGNLSSEQVISTRQTLIIEDAQTSPLTEPIHDQMIARGIQTLIIIPMVVSNEVIGTVGLDLQQAGRKLRTEDIRLAETIVLQATAAANNIRLFDQTQKALSETAALYEASARLSAAQTFDDILQVLKSYTVPGQQAQQIALSYFDRPWNESYDPEYFEVVAYLTNRGEALAQNRFHLNDFPDFHELLQPDSPTIVANVVEDLRLSDQTRQLYLRSFGSQSTIFLPLSVGGQWLGFINILFKGPTNFAEADLRRLIALTNQAAVSVQTLRLLDETSHLYEQEQRRAQREQALRQITAQVRNTVDIDTILQTAVQEIGRVLGRKTIIQLQSGDRTNGHANSNPGGHESSKDGPTTTTSTNDVKEA